MKLARQFFNWNESQAIRWNVWAAHRYGRISGMWDFEGRVLPGLLRPGLRVLDVGGGKQPLIPVHKKCELGLHVTGLDISAEELAAAPAQAYDATIVGDVSHARLPENFDLILSRTVLEHVPDTSAAISNLSAALAKGGVMAHFLPCANAPFARVNRLLGPRASAWLLWKIFPVSRSCAGFPAYYDNCTPKGLGKLCESSGLETVAVIPYFCSDYVRFLLPLHLIDLSRQILLLKAGVIDSAETFAIICRKPIAIERVAA